MTSGWWRQTAPPPPPYTFSFVAEKTRPGTESTPPKLWFYHAGAPLLLSLSPDGKTLTNYRLGSDLLAGERPQGVVPPHCWQAARSLGEWTLVSCTVAPGFEFARFELATPEFAPKEKRGDPA